KLREAMGSQIHNPDSPELSGEVQVDGAYFGGHVKPENRKADRIDRRLAEERTGKRQVVVVAREVRGRTLPFIVPRESDAVPLIRKHVASGTIIHADESNAWERLHASYDVRRVNHSQEYKAEDGANVNQAESYFSGLIEKRRELAGIIDQLQRQIDQRRADLVHIDGVLRVLATDLDPATIRPKRAYRRNRYFARNELSRLCLGALRIEPLSTDDIA